MKRSKNIVLVLTSIVVLSSCKKSPQEDLWDGQNSASPTPTSSSGSHAGGGVGFFWRPFVPIASGGSSGYGGGFSGTGESSVARGGFGSTGEAAGHGSSSS